MNKPRRCHVRREVWEVQDVLIRKDEKKGKASARKQDRSRRSTYRDIQGTKRRDRNEIVFGIRSYLPGSLKFAKTL